MKVTTQMFFDRFLNGLQSNMEAIMNGSNQLSTGKKINQPSDDPATISRIVNYKTQLSLNSEYTRAMTMAKGPLESMDSSLTNLSDALQRANELAMSGASATVDANSKIMIAKEVNGLLDTAVGIANTKVSDRYLFSGYKTSTAPIDTTTGELIGDSNKFEVEISLGVKVALNIPAANLFSFKRTNTTDPADAILPSYNRNFDTNPANVDVLTGLAKTPADADPISALYTNQPVFVINGNTVTIDGGAPIALGIPPGSYTGSDLATALNGVAGIAAANLSFSYNSATNKYTVANAGGVAHAFTGASAGFLEMLGFTAPVNIAAGGSATSTNTAGRIMHPLTDVVSPGGGTLSITVGSNDNSPANVTIGANATLKDIYTAIMNTPQAASKVKPYIVNFNTTGDSAKDDYRLIVASNPAGKSDQINLSVTAPTDPANTGLNNLAYTAGSATGMKLGDDGRITNYNYITDNNNKNYYSFNNNYLNENNILRALNFLKVSLENNDMGRIRKSLAYLGNVMDKTSLYTSEVGASLNQIGMEGKYTDDRNSNIQTYLSVDQDIDISKVYSDISQRQVALQSLKLVSADFMKASLFDFLR